MGADERTRFAKLLGEGEPMNTAGITFYHHPFTRATTALWMLEEVGQPYELRFIDVMKGEQKTPDFLAINPMGKVPALTDNGQVITESAAICLYLADRYALGRLAPACDQPERGAYLRWSLFAPSVIEPGLMANVNKWEFKAAQAGWGALETMLDTMEAAIGQGPWLLGEQFTAADVIMGSIVRLGLRFQILPVRSAFTRYAERLGERPAVKRADEINAKLIAEHNIAM